jgi:hypothetical protein
VNPFATLVGSGSNIGPADIHSFNIAVIRSQDYLEVAIEQAIQETTKRAPLCPVPYLGRNAMTAPAGAAQQPPKWSPFLFG